MLTLVAALLIALTVWKLGMRRHTPALAALLLAFSGCLAQHASSRFPEGTEPEVKLSEVSLVDSGTDQGRITLNVHNPNEWPITLVRLRVQAGGAVRAQNQPEYSSLRLEVPGRASRQLDIAMHLTQRPQIRPDAVAPEQPPYPAARPRAAYTEIRGQLFFSTPQGEFTVYLNDKRRV